MAGVVGAAGRRRRDMAVVGGIEVLLLTAFAILGRYDTAADAAKADPFKDELHPRYPMFQDVHVMIFIGFGFLMTFLRKYGYSSVGFNLLVGAMIVQWAILCRGLFDLDPVDSKIHISMTSLLSADLAAATVLISMGAVLGKTTPLQLLLMGLIEIVIAAANEHLGVNVLKAVDAGASMYVHVFGAYFGLMISLVLGHGSRIRKGEGNSLEGASYTSDLFSMLGTVFLWMFWPSFNGALISGDDQHRAVINTYLSLASCCVTAFVLSSLLSKDNKFDMVHIQNATLAGGVAVGTAADMMVQPWGALAIGTVAALVSVMGYRYLQPILLQHLRLHDTCGVHNLHGMPGILAGFIGALLAGLATKEEYGFSVYEQFPARSPPINATDFAEAKAHIPGLEPGTGRDAMGQAGYQLLALAITFVVASVSGLVTGFILKLPFLDTVNRDHWFSDDYHWEVEEVEETTKQQTNGGNADDDNKTDTTFCDSRLHI